MGTSDDVFAEYRPAIEAQVQQMLNRLDTDNFETRELVALSALLRPVYERSMMGTRPRLEIAKPEPDETA